LAVLGYNAMCFVDLTSGTVGAAIPLNTTATPPGSGLCWAPDSSQVYVLEPQYYALTAVPISGPPFKYAFGVGTLGGGGNAWPCVSPDGRYVYMPGAVSTGVWRMDTTVGAGSMTLQYPISGIGVPTGIAITGDGTKLYVTDNSAPGVLNVVTVAGGAVTPVAVNNHPFGVCLSPDGTTVWVACGGGAVQAISTASLAVTHTLTAGFGGPSYINIDPTGKTVWVADGPQHTVFGVDVPTLAVGTALGGLATSLSSIGILPSAAAGGLPPGGVISATVALGPLTLTASGTVSGSAGTVTGTATLNLGPFTVSARTSLETVTAAASILVGPLVVGAVSGRVGPQQYPVPGYRGRWRLTLHTRKYVPASLSSTIIAELADARGRQLVQAWNTPASLTFTLDGHSQAAGLIDVELFYEVVAWRWDDQTGLEFPVFRGPITQSEDQISTESHTVTYICHDYGALLARRLLTGTGPYTAVGRDQDLIVSDLLAAAVNAHSSSGVSFSPASFLPVSLYPADPAGNLRGQSGRARDRTYYGSQNVGTAIDDLAKVIGGFDWDVKPSPVDVTDNLRLFYPAQGVNRTDIVLQYGSTVQALTRTVNSADYANYVRVLGNNQSSDPTPQLYAEDWDSTAISITTPAGLWMLGDDAADVTVQSTLNDKASGTLALDTILVPHYTLTLSPDAYTWGHPNMGDTVGLVVQSGRLNVASLPPGGGVRVLGITYDISDDDAEDVTLVVNRPARTFKELLTSPDRDLKALARR